MRPETVLEAFGLGGAVPQFIARGNMNHHWAIGVPGKGTVVKRYNALRTAPAVVWEHALIAYAAGRGWPVAKPIAAAGSTVFEHEGQLWSAAPYLRGEHGSETSVGMRTIYGRLLARLHRDLEAFPAEGQRPGAGKVWELDVIARAGGSESFNRLVAEFGRDYPELAARVRRERYRNLHELSRLHYPDLPDRPIHGDFEPWNLLFDAGQLTGVLDFDQARRDALACDIAPVLMPFLPLDLPLAQAFLRGYESVRQLTETEWALLPALVRASLLGWVAFLLARWRMNGEEPAGVARTMTVRFPAWDAFEAQFRGLRG